MRKATKILLIVLASIILLCVIVFASVSWYFFTPEKLTPIIREQMKQGLVCDADIQTAEPVFFSTFPDFNIRIKGLQIINPVKNTPNDTLVFVDEVLAAVDIMRLLKSEEILIKKASLSKGTITIFVDSLGNTNYDIAVADTSVVEESSELPELTMENISFKDINFSFIDRTQRLIVVANDINANMDGNLKNNILHCNVDAGNMVLSFQYDKEAYLKNDTLQLETTFDYSLDYLKMNIDDAKGTINSFPIAANGTIVEDTTTTDLIFDLYYHFPESPVENLLPMVPPSYQSYFDDISVKGNLAVDGSIIGNMGDDSMPMFFVGLNFNNCEFAYSDMPLKLYEVAGQVDIKTDVVTDSLTYVEIKNIEGQTEQSSFCAQGRIGQLYSDIACSLKAQFDLTLDEFNPMIPAEIKTKLKGKAKGNIATAFTMSQIEKERYDKIKASGQVELSGFDAVYDTLWVNTPFSAIDFSLPNKDRETKTGFLKMDVKTRALNAGSKDNMKVQLGESKFFVATSNVLDTTQIPFVDCSFNLKSMAAIMDTINCSLAASNGEFYLQPGIKNKLDPSMKLRFEAQEMAAQTMRENVDIERLSVNTSIVNDSKQENPFLRWAANGAFDMENANIRSLGLLYPVEIPSINMDFNVDTFNIKQSQLIIDKSDFNLDGKLTNIYPYFMGDSILKGRFNFVSDHTDLSQLMALTNNMGYEERETTEATSSDSVSSGPYMVPLNVDAILTTNIKEIAFGDSYANNVAGNVVVKDGILVLDSIRLTSPATNIQMTAIYKTPRRNHLYLGLDYHMLDIEIEELLKIIPDVDSLMPMLRSFKGAGEFHMAVETHLDSLYNLKMSTLLGAASLTGHDLVLMDGETFTEISKKLKFSRKAENKVDSLSAEFTVFRNEVDVYPFIIVMDKYKAIIAGKHNFDLSFDYHISLIKSPLPMRLGLDITGTLEDMDYKLVPCKYAEKYRPAARFRVSNKQVELRKLIKESLTVNVAD